MDTNKRLTPGHFICRFLVSPQSSALQKVSPHSMLPRGMEYSHYAYAYAEHIKALNVDYQSDPFSVAIQRLHISVIPDSLPCRGAERTAIEEYIRSGILSHGSHRPIYICGMPGMLPLWHTILLPLKLLVDCACSFSFWLCCGTSGHNSRNSHNSHLSSYLRSKSVLRDVPTKIRCMTEYYFFSVHNVQSLAYYW